MFIILLPHCFVKAKKNPRKFSPKRTNRKGIIRQSDHKKAVETAITFRRLSVSLNPLVGIFSKNHLILQLGNSHIISAPTAKYLGM